MFVPCSLQKGTFLEYGEYKVVQDPNPINVGDSSMWIGIEWDAAKSEFGKRMHLQFQIPGREEEQEDRGGLISWTFFAGFLATTLGGVYLLF